jgi:DNA-binding NarL/FixJ family response regulator
LVITDDHELVVEGLTTRLNGEPDMQVVATASSGARLLALLPTLAADVVVLDLHMAEEDGLQVLAQIRAQQIPVKVLILTALTDGGTLQRALELEADGIVLKTEPTRQVVAAIRAVAAGQVVYPRTLHKSLLRRADRQAASPVEALTARERAVLALLAEGRTNQEIAARLDLSHNTVKYHIQNIYGKLQVTNRTEATRRFLDGL